MWSSCYVREAVGQEASSGLVPWWVRAVLLLSAAQALLLVAALIEPTLVKLLVPWPASPLNARFIAALYVSLGLGVVLASTSRRFVEVRIALFGIGMVTLVLLVLTFVRMALHPGEVRVFPVLWTLFYIIDPLLVALVFWRLRWGGGASAGWRRATWLWVVQAVIFASTGLLLMLAPSVARSLWPWLITEPQAQLYSAFFLTLAACSLIAAREEAWAGVRWFVVMIVLLSLLVVGVSLLHLPRFSQPMSTTIWFSFFAAEALVFGGLFVHRTLRWG
jgi:hypothetical protein